MNPEENKKQRLVSLDALRGFTMFWIIGGDALFHALAEATNLSFFVFMSDQLTHLEWEGFHFYDLIFPMFIFISGVTVPFSLGRKLAKGEEKKKLLLKVAKRSFILILLGIIYNNEVSFDFANLRYASVLGQIGVAYFIGTTIYLYASRIAQYVWLIGLFVFFWIIMNFIPVPGIGAGVLTPEGTFSGYIDRLILPGKLYDVVFDPEGIIQMLSASVVALAGILTGKYLLNVKYNEIRKSKGIAIAGVLFIAAGLGWSIWYPIIKKVWTGSYELLVIGLSMLFLSGFYYIIDVRKISRWAFFFVVIGMNSIMIYMGTRLIEFYYTSGFILNGIMNWSGSFFGVVHVIGVITLEWLLLYYLFRKRIFFKV